MISVRPLHWILPFHRELGNFIREDTWHLTSFRSHGLDLGYTNLGLERAITDAHIQRLTQCHQQCIQTSIPIIYMVQH